MNRINKLFGEIELTWKKLIIFAIFSGVYTAFMALIPSLKDTSFHDIVVTFEVWIFFGIMIIMNSKSNKDASLKCFVFFLISQPLVYLIQVPFNDEGFAIFRYYRYWFIWTILTIPMGYIGYYMKKDKWYGVFILIPMLLLLGVGSYYYYLKETIFSFPYHLLTTLFCLFTMFMYSLCIFRNRKNKLITLIFSFLLVVVLTILAFINRKTYNVILLPSGSIENVVFNDKCSVYLDSDMGEVYIRYDEGLEDYLIEGEFTKSGKSDLVLIDEEGNRYTFELVIKSDTYQINLN